MSTNVKVWAFGHTHFSCQFVHVARDAGLGVERRKLVVSNQKGYASAEGSGNWTIDSMVVGRKGGQWNVIVCDKPSGTVEEKVI